MTDTLTFPAVQMFSKSVSDAGTDNSGFSTGMTAAIDTRVQPGVGSQVPQVPRHLTLLIGRGTVTGATAPNKLLTYTIGHAASITDATSNSTALFTISETANTALNVVSRAEIDLVGLNPIIRVAITRQNTATQGTAEAFPLTITALLSRPEQTPLASSVLANGQVKIWAAGATQSN